MLKKKVTKKDLEKKSQELEKTKRLKNKRVLQNLEKDMKNSLYKKVVISNEKEGENDV